MDSVRPRLGVLINAEYPVSELVAIGEAAERLGYSQFWYTDLRFARDCYLGLAAVAARTERLLLGPGVSDPFTRHPAMIATSVATLDEMSGGRALLGLGIGSGLQQLGIETRVPVAAMREAFTVLRGLLRGEEVTVEGKVITLRGGRLSFPTVQKSLPIYVATHGAQVTRLTGELADGVLLANLLVPEALDHYLMILREGEQRAGRATGVAVSLRFEVCLSDDLAAATRVMRRRVASRLVSQYPHWEYLASLGVSLPSGFAEAASAGRSRLDDAIAGLPDEVLHRTVLVGRPDDVARRISNVLRPRVDSITIRPHAVEGQHVTDVMRSFVDEVMPRVTLPAVEAPG